MSKFFSEKFQSLEEYTPGEQPKEMEYIKLNTNENPYHMSFSSLQSISKIDVMSMKKYNDPNAKVLVKKLAETYDVECENIIVGNGSDEILAFIFQAYSDKATVFPDITYGLYEVFAKLYQMEMRTSPLDENFCIDLADYENENENENVVIANPNAPTGKHISLQEIEKICQSKKNAVVVIDEAYIDFGGESASGLIKIYDNLIVVQTFSKSRFLAGGRVGFAIANVEIIKDLNKIRNSFNPYNVNSISQKLAVGILNDEKYFNECIEKIKNTREFFTEELRKIGFVVESSSANFVFAKPIGIEAKELYENLKNEGVLVRWFGKKRLSSYLRITIGTKDQMKIVIEKMKKILEEKEYEKGNG